MKNFILALALSLAAFTSTSHALEVTVEARFSRFVAKQLTVGTSQVVLPPTVQGDAIGPGATVQYVTLQALSTNTATITVGATGVVDKGAGIEIAAGQTVVLRSNRISSWFAISSAASQKLNVVYFAGVE